MKWVYGTWLVDDQGVTWFCGMSGDVEKDEDGCPTKPWIKLGVSATREEHDTSFLPHEWRVIANRGPTSPCDRTDVRVLVRCDRPGVGSAASNSKAIADWPLQCPKCRRQNAAVLLFTSYDCRFGCFKGGGL